MQSIYISNMQKREIKISYLTTKVRDEFKQIQDG
jgi:hypothetical protein